MQYKYNIIQTHIIEKYNGQYRYFFLCCEWIYNPQKGKNKIISLVSPQSAAFLQTFQQSINIIPSLTQTNKQTSNRTHARVHTHAQSLI